jgi:hypothetical protein
MDSIVLLVLVLIGLIILAKQGWLGLMSDTADVVKNKMSKKIIEIEAEDQYQHAKNLGKTASKWDSNDRQLANKKMVDAARERALAKYLITDE